MPSDFIEEYSFGKIIIENDTYVNDIILLGRDIKPDWRRKTGHSLTKEDLKDVIEYEPELLIIGTGSYGMMDVPADLQKELNFKIIAFSTEKAVSIYNHEINKDEKIAGVFHLTC
jgi:hypothetical protein